MLSENEALTEASTKKKRIGPRIEPCATTQLNGDTAEEYWPRQTQKLLSARYDWDQLRAASLMPTCVKTR